MRRTNVNNRKSTGRTRKSFLNILRANFAGIGIGGFLVAAGSLAILAITIGLLVSPVRGIARGIIGDDNAPVNSISGEAHPSAPGVISTATAVPSATTLAAYPTHTPIPVYTTGFGTDSGNNDINDYWDDAERRRTELDDYSSGYGMDDYWDNNQSSGDPYQNPGNSINDYWDNLNQRRNNDDYP